MSYKNSSGILLSDLNVSVNFVPLVICRNAVLWPAPGSEDTELGVLMELEVGKETEVYSRVQA